MNTALQKPEVMHGLYELIKSLTELWEPVLVCLSTQPMCMSNRPHNGTSLRAADHILTWTIQHCQRLIHCHIPAGCNWLTDICKIYFFAYHRHPNWSDPQSNLRDNIFKVSAVCLVLFVSSQSTLVVKWRSLLSQQWCNWTRLMVHSPAPTVYPVWLYPNTLHTA